MASLAVTATPAQLSLPPGTPVSISGAGTVTFGLTSAGASTGPVLANGSATYTTWPGIFCNFGLMTFWVVSTTTNAIAYPS